MKGLLLGVAIGLVLSALSWYVRGTLAEPRIQQLRSERDSIGVLIGERDVVIGELHARRMADSVRADSVIAEAELVARTRYSEARRTAADLRAALAGDAELVAQLDSLTAAYEATVEALHLEVGELEQLRVDDRILIQQQDLQLADYREGELRAIALIAELERKIDPPWHVELVGDLPKLGLSALIGVAIGKAW